ncbi:MAG: heparan N-sulfatase, partial [Planctomycetota bacterium]|nr:heparan N-sulfatase [Planctomycetota bacterium]
GKPGKKHYDGSSFLEVLAGKTQKHRSYVYGIHNNIPEGPAYPIRTVSDGKYRYIRNLLPNELYIEKHLMGMRGNGQLNNPYWSTWVRETWANAHTYKLVKRYMKRPPEQLYHTEADRYELENLAGRADQSERLGRLRTELDRWLKTQSDPGAPVDTDKAIQAARKGRHLYGASPGGK